MGNNKGFKVTPLSSHNIRTTANALRNLLFSSDSTSVDIIGIYEFVLPTMFPNFVLEICEEKNMGDDHGRTYPDKNLIQLREDIYHGALNDNGRDRFTMAHELGHLILHQELPLARTIGQTPHKPYEDSEWQANTFASEFLMPEQQIIQYKDALEISEKCKVSYKAALVRFAKLKK